MSDIDKDIETLKQVQAIFEHFKKHGWINDIKRDVDTDKAIASIENVLSELEETRQTLKCTQDSWYKDSKDLETWQKIAEKLAELINNHDIDEDVCRQMGKDFDCTLFNQDEKFCVQCIIDWARKEVENEKRDS